ncbi:MAG TPA: MarR family transcriptional regulator [Candidatus Bacteroides pullicola]|uniref:MarR family transcriptional regulator n=1 Tax=Candidatus Bacteroides pullicola TaxID=2838475 RepID=A0A9D2CLV6_9BACE|nr:MarR family transcriptional regulator [Candidatus Bacteroides pullicola]
MKDKPTLSTCIPAGKPVLDYLKEKSGERHTKLEAYCDLLDKASAGYVSDVLRKLDVELQPGQLAVTITDLAECWHWHRATVRSFLNGLESLGQIKKSALTRSYVITMAEVGGNEKEAGKNKGKRNNPLMDKVDAALSEWVFGKVSGAECGQVCQRLTDAETPDGATRTTDGLPDNDKAAYAETCRTIMERMALAAVRRVLRKYRFGPTVSLTGFFNDVLAEDFTLMPEAMETLAELVIDGESESLELEDAQTKETFRTLCKPFKTVLADSLETGNGN